MTAEETSFLWTVAHELRTPLCSVLMNAEVLTAEASEMSNGEVVQMARSIQRGARWLQSTVDNLLTQADIAAGWGGMRLKPARLSDVVADATLVMEPLLARKHQRVRVTRRGRGRAMDIDSQLIRQAVLNLISNASKFSGEGTTIDVTIDVGRHLGRVIVADRGPGIPMGTCRDLFRPFYRAGDVREREIPGLGLGLTIVKSIVGAHRGRVGAENRPGGGARFWIELPHAPTRQPHR